MPESIVPYNIDKNLPFEVSERLAQLPETVQHHFVKEYKMQSKSLVITYVLGAFWGCHNIYLGKYLRQLAFWATFGGLGFWYVLDFIKMPEMVREENDKIAKRLLKELMYKYGLRNNSNKALNYEIKQGIVKLAPKEFKEDYDPTHLTVENLKPGYIVDYQQKTWVVKNMRQHDWDNGTTEREFFLLNEDDVLVISIAKTHNILTVNVAKPVSVYLLDANMDVQINKTGDAPKIINYEGVSYFRENKKKGNMFDHALNWEYIRTQEWEFFDKDRKRFIKILHELERDKNILAVIGNKASVGDFREVLPGS